MSECFAPANADGVELCFETFGDPGDPTVLLVMGLATQMLGWHEDFCARLAGRGFHVVRYDNRDVGRSTKMSGKPPSLKQMALRDRRAVAYTISDMARDGISLLEHLDVDRAHVVGASMGGMIAQTMAFEHPERVLSLVSIMSNAGGRLKGQPKPAVLPMFLKKAPSGDRSAYAEHVAKMYELIGSPGFDRDPQVTTERAGMAYDRGVNPAGAGRQLMAVLADANRTAKLRTITAPTLVIHGKADRLVHASGGREVAAAVPGAELEIIDGMGHDLPEGVWDRVIDGIVRTVNRAGRPAAAR